MPWNRERLLVPAVLAVGVALGVWMAGSTTSGRYAVSAVPGGWAMRLDTVTGALALCRTTNLDVAPSCGPAGEPAAKR